MRVACNLAAVLLILLAWSSEHLWHSFSDPADRFFFCKVYEVKQHILRLAILIGCEVPFYLSQCNGNIRVLLFPAR